MRVKFGTYVPDGWTINVHFETIMVMKKTTSSQVVRVSVAEAKSHLSALLRSLPRQAVVIHNRGRDVARLVATDSTSTAHSEADSKPFVRFLNRIEDLKKSTGVKGVSFSPQKIKIRPRDLFGSEE